MTTLQYEPRLRLWIDGVELPLAGDRVLELEVEESTDAASSFRMTFDMSPVSDAAEGDWSLLERGPFQEATGGPTLELMSRITIGFVLAPDPGAGEVIAENVFDGYVTEMHPVFGEARVEDSRLEVSGLDASCLMHFQTVVKTWSGKSDSEIAATIFQKYGFKTDGTSIEKTAPVRELVRGAMVQRCTDAEFLRLLARRNGFETYVELEQGEITEAAHSTVQTRGHFHAPGTEGREVDTTKVQPELQLFPRDAPSLLEFDARWESHQPTRMRSWRLNELTRLIERKDTTDPGYPRLGQDPREKIIGARLKQIEFGGPAMDPSEGAKAVNADTALNVLEASEIFSGRTPHHSTELEAMNTAAMREADWFVRGAGVVRAERYPAIVRPRRPVGLNGAGHLLNGIWYCLSVCHRWARNQHLAEGAESEQVSRRYEADVRLARHGLGPGAGAASREAAS
ncbi:hypothetical protein [Mesorhizobium sp. CN2-181]|uniref:hypothetical protein n=1 Tax=Mesorhizobium yinganensis TaxID=3157707 RepID=UPI0032B7C1E4